jgi:hypothetical protein
VMIWAFSKPEEKKGESEVIEWRIILGLLFEMPPKRAEASLIPPDELMRKEKLANGPLLHSGVSYCVPY